MKNITRLVVALFVLFATAAFADKPTWAGKKGKPTAGEKVDHKDAMRAKRGGDHKDKDHKDHADKGHKDHDHGKDKDHKDHADKGHKDHDHGKDGDHKGNDRKVDKTDKEKKELGRGSEEGQDARSQRKKWWKFWGE